jgi:hypothetical protein
MTNNAKASTVHAKTAKSGKSFSKSSGDAPSPAVRAAMDRLAKNPKTIKLSRSLRPTD